MSTVDLAALIEQLDDLEARYQEWVEPINRVIKECSYKVNRDGYTVDDFERDVGEVRERQRARYDPYQEMFALLDQLCPAYLDATPPERDEIRAAVSGKNGMLAALLGYVYKAATQIRSQADREWLRRGLAAASIENCGRDYRDVLLALAELYVAAEEAGINPRADFRAVSKLSDSRTPKGGATPMSSVLANFHNYGALKERRARGRSWQGG